MNKFITEKLKSVSWQWYALLLVLVIGIFLRTYNFHNWLRFNADQGRDAEVVSSVVDGTAPIPLLGPKAGGTNFKLGPAFYYFEIASAKIFGNAPDKMAYPDLFTGILCIPLLYFFLRKYFDQRISLSLTIIFAVSNYAIRYARFAWNPNSTPFWTILALYAIHEVILQRDNRKFLWAAVAGIAIGIGVQLHTTLLLFLPITTIIIFGYLFLKKQNKLKYFLVIFSVALIFNIPQLIDLQQTNGANLSEFFRGIKTKQSSESSIFNNIWQGNNTLVQIEPDILSGYEMADKFDINFNHAKTRDLLVFLLSLVFTLGGVILAIRYFRNETNVDKKAFLAVIFAYTSIAYLIFVKLAFELSVRFYLVLIFLPFFLLGFWIQYLREKFAARQTLILLVIPIFLVGSNLFFVQQSFGTLANYDKKGGGNVDITILQEAETFARFIEENSNDTKDVYVGGNVKFLFKAYRSLKYLTGMKGVNILQVNAKTILPSQYFYIASTSEKDKLSTDANVKILNYKTFGGFSILLLQNGRLIQ